MGDALGGPILRRSGDSFFNYIRGDQIFMIHVTHECLADVFGSDGSKEKDEAAIRANFHRITNIANAKIQAGASSPVHVLNSDF